MMSITILETIMPLVADELQNLSRRYPQHAESLRRAVEEFRILYGQRVFRNIAELTTFCREVDHMEFMRTLDPALVVPIRESRRLILASVAQESIRMNPPNIRDMDPDREIRGARGTGSETPQNRLRPRTSEELREIVEEYVGLAAQVGEEEVVQILISLNRLTVDDIPRAIRTLRMYLGRSRGGGGGGGVDILDEDDQILQIQSVRRVLNKMLLHLSYNTLVGLGGDTMQRHEHVRSRAGRESRFAMEDLARKAGSDPRKHRHLFDERKAYIEQAAALHVPDCFVRTIEHQGVMHPLPSWRQRIAIMEAQRQQHVIIGFEPGLGKTFIPIWFYQLLAERRLAENKGKGRMLYIGPKIVMSELPNRIRPGSVQGIAGHSYYVSDDLAPTVGVITDGLDTAEIEARMNADIVFCPYTMLNTVKDDIAISDRLAAHRHQTTGEPFTICVADECHRIKGKGDWTERIRHIIHQTPRLYRDGNVLFMSGTPATNTLADLRVISELLEPEGNRGSGNHSNNRRDRTLHPAFMRNMLERLVILDPPGDWQAHVTPFPYDLARDDQRLVNAIARDSTLHSKEKIDATLRIIRSTDNMLGYTCAQLEEFLEQRHTVLIAENIHAQGVTREWNRERNEQDEEENQGDPIFRDKVIAFLEQWSRDHGNMPVHFSVIDGKNNKTLRQRQEIFRLAAESDRTGTSKSVILTHTSCLNEGIDLRFIRRMIALEWPWNSPELQQLLQRSLRAGNEDIFLTAFFAQDTLEQGIFEVAEDKYADVRACLYGQGLSDQRLRRAGRDDSEMSRTSRLLEKLQSPEQRQEFIQRILHGRGMKHYQKFWERDRNRQFFKEHLDQANVSGIGDSERYVGSLISALENSSIINGNQYLHVHSQGLRLERFLHRNSPNQERQVLSMDPTEYMLEDGHAALRADNCEITPRILRGGLTHLIRLMKRGQIQKGSLDAVVIEGLENTRATLPASGALQFSERLRSLVGAVRTLRSDGTLIIAMPKGACTQEEFGKFCAEVLPRLGLTVLNAWSGEGRSTDNEGDPAFRMFTVVAKKTGELGGDLIRQIPASALQMTHSSQWGDTRERSRLENDRKRRMLPYQLVHTQFQIGRHEFGLNHVSEERAKQVVHLRCVQEGVKAVRNLAPTAKEFSELPSSQRDELLSNIGVAYLSRVSPSKRRPAFQVIAYPDYFFYPYDQQWNDPE